MSKVPSSPVTVSASGRPDGAARSSTRVPASEAVVSSPAPSARVTRPVRRAGAASVSVRVSRLPGSSVALVTPEASSGAVA